MKVVKGGLTTPKGFVANGLAAKIKRSGKPDLGLIASTTPAVCAGVFTKNSVKAAPVIVSQNHLKNLKAQAVIVNSGNANCFTGKFGFIYAQKTTELIGQLLNIPKEDVVVASTGIIGRPLPYNKIENAADALVKGLSVKGGSKVAKAILTTDLKIKEIAVTFKISGKTVTIGGCAKGSGMIEPNMATMLAFINTDAAISGKLLKKALKEVTEETFNCISVDGCMSTNDMVTVMANGQAGNKPILTQGKDYYKFLEALKFICLDLAKKIVVDGEGATKFIEITVKGAKTTAMARKVAMAIANSNLFKTAAFAGDPNWGRVAAAIGSVCIDNVTEENLKMKFSSFAKKHITITADLNIGDKQITVYTSDLSYEYVRINGEYT